MKALDDLVGGRGGQCHKKWAVGWSVCLLQISYLIKEKALSVTCKLPLIQSFFIPFIASSTPLLHSLPSLPHTLPPLRAVVYSNGDLVFLYLLSCLWIHPFFFTCIFSKWDIQTKGKKNNWASYVFGHRKIPQHFGTEHSSPLKAISQCYFSFTSKRYCVVSKNEAAVTEDYSHFHSL